MDLFDNFDIQDNQNKKQTLLNKKRKPNLNNQAVDNKESNKDKELSSVQIENDLTLKEQSILKEKNKEKAVIKLSNPINYANPDMLIENRLKGLIDNEELIKGSEEIKKMGNQCFDVKGCTHEVFTPVSGHDFTCKC